MHFIRYNQTIVSFLIIFLLLIQFGESIPSNYNNENIKDLQKRDLTINLPQNLANRLNKMNEENQKERVTEHFKDPSDPNSYG